MKPGLSVTNLSVQYPHESRYAVKDISFSLKKGEIGVLLGPNGSGKSTIIKALLSLVGYDGQVLFSGAPLQSVRGLVGYVPQRYPLDKSIPITVSEFLLLALVMCSHSHSQKKQMLKAVLAKVDLPGTEDTSVASLSGGQLQRLLLARALVHEPAFLLLDEPEAGVDVEGEQVFYSLLQKLATEDTVTVLIASHELALVQQFADVVMCVSTTLVCTGKPAEVLTADTFKKLYGKGVLLYGHAHDHSHDHAAAHTNTQDIHSTGGSQ